MGKGSREELLAAKSASLGKSAAPQGGVGQAALGFVVQNYRVILQVLVAVVAVVFTHTIWKQSSSGVQNLINASDATLKSVLLGDKPFLFYCHRGGKNEIPPVVFSQMHETKSATVGFGILNCSQVMPSGKTIMDRFGLKREWRPIMFATAPWSKPKQIPPPQMKDFATLRKYFAQVTAARATEVQSDKELSAHCGFARNVTFDDRSVGETCVVLVKGKRHGKKQVELEEWLVHAFPKVKMASVDATKRRLSFEDPAALPADDFALKVHALRNGTHSLTMESPLTWDYLNTFVSHAVGSPLFSFESDGLRVSLVKTGAASSAFKDRSAKFQQQQQYKSGGGAGSGGSGKGDRRRARAQQGGSGGGGDKAAPDGAAGEGSPETPEDKAAREAAREARRREQMERQAKERLFEQQTGEGEGEGGDEGEGDDEEDIVEL